MVPTVSEFDVLFLVLVAMAAGFFFAVVVGAQGSDGRRWWRSRFGVGWPTIGFLYVFLVVGIWLPVAYGSRSPGYYDGLFAIGALVFIAGALAVALAVGNARPYLLLSVTPSSHASDADTGRLAVEGSVEPATADTGSDRLTVEAPLSSEDVVTYRLKVDTVPAYASPDQQKKQRETALNREESTPFLVRDATGAVRVEPSSAQLRIASPGERRFTPNDDLPDSLATLLDREGVERRGTELICEEARLAPGDDVFVHGRASPAETGVVVAGGSEFLVVPGSRADALADLHGTVVVGGFGGLLFVGFGLLVMAVETQALSF